MSSKSSYRIKNWSDYNRSLINRGNITLWLSEDVISNWRSKTELDRGRGRPKLFSDQWIESILQLRILFSLPLRSTQGLMMGFNSILEIDAKIPNYTTLSRRSASLKIELGNLNWKKPMHVVIDATGLKVFGEGEWHCRTHGKSKRRTWRKFHIAIDRETLEIVNVDLTQSNVHDSKMTAALLKPLKNIKSVTGDKGYDNRNAYDPIAAKAARAIVPPRSGAALKVKNISWGDVERNRNILENHRIGIDAWKYGTGYTKRSRVENAIGRYKRIIGATLHSRKLANQQTEVRMAAQILNRMTQLGMPKSYKL